MGYFGAGHPGPNTSKQLYPVTDLETKIKVINYRVQKLVMVIALQSDMSHCTIERRLK